MKWYFLSKMGTGRSVHYSLERWLLPALSQYTDIVQILRVLRVLLHL